MPTMAEVRAKYPQYQDMSDEQLAGALHKKFYSDMPAEQFAAKIGLAPPAPINPRERAMQVRAMPADQREMPSEAAMRSPLGNLAQSRGQSFGQGAADTGGMGFADEGGAALGSMLTGNSYADTLKEMRDIKAGAQQQNPGSFLAGQVTGAVAPAVVGGSAGPALLTGATKLAKPAMSTLMRVGAKAGATQGGIYGFGSGEGLPDRLASGAGGAVSGAVVGSLAPAVTSAVTGTISKLAGAFNKGPAKTATEAVLRKLNTNKEAAYALSEKAGVIIKPQGMQSLQNNMIADISQFGYDEIAHPGAKILVNRIASLQGQNVTLKGLDGIRKLAGNVGYIPGNKPNNAVVSKIVKHIEDLEQSGDTALIQGLDTAVGQQALDIARKFAHRAFKMETALNLVKKGNQLADRNITDTRVRSVKSQLAKINDPFSNWGRGYTAAEKEAAGKAAKYTTPQRMLHGASVLNPAAGGKLSAAGHIALAGTNLMSGNIPGLALQAAGAGAGVGFQKWGEALAKRSVDEFVDIVARGGVPAPVVKNAMQRLTESKRNAITQSLIRAGVTLTPNQQR